MTTSSSTDFEPNVAEFIEEAFERCGLELRTGYDLKTAKRSINIMLAEWANRGLNQWTIEQTTQALTEGTSEYSLNSNVIDILDMVVRRTVNSTQTDISIDRLSRSQYINIPNKNTKARPSQFFFDKLNAPVIKIWPSPENSTDVLVFNKIDTLDEPTLDEQLYMQYVYEQIGYKCLRVSSTEMKGIEALKELMIGKVSMFSGHSGVGKSTLVNAMEPSLHLKTKTISDASKQGQHTTTFAEMYDLSFGASIIDTPGIKGFGMVDMEPYEISGYFPEFFKLKDQCKFNNCLHKEEPKCAVKEALEKDEIAWSRYNSYLKILEGDEEHYRTDIYNEDRAESDKTRGL